jgi:hypothetical protein
MHPNIYSTKRMGQTNEFLTTHLPRVEEEGYAYLSTLPEVKRFLDTEIFQSIELVRGEALGHIIMLGFDVIAPDLMPHPRARLIENGLVKRHNLLHSSIIPEGISQTIGFFGNCLQITLNIRSQALEASKTDEELLASGISREQLENAKKTLEPLFFPHAKLTHDGLNKVVENPDGTKSIAVAFETTYDWQRAKSYPDEVSFIDEMRLRCPPLKFEYVRGTLYVTIPLSQLTNYASIQPPESHAH